MLGGGQLENRIDLFVKAEAEYDPAESGGSRRVRAIAWFKLDNTCDSLVVIMLTYMIYF